MLDKWFCQVFAGEQPEPSSSAPLYGGAHRRVNLRRCVPTAFPCVTYEAEWHCLSIPCFLELLPEDPPIVRNEAGAGGYTSRLCAFAAAMKLANRGCGSNGRDFSSGWNCTPMNQG